MQVLAQCFVHLFIIAVF